MHAVACALLLLLAACGQAAPVASRSPTPLSSASAAPSPTAVTSTPRRTTPEVRGGAPAYVAVAMATVWRSPSSPRPVDAPALTNPARVREWLAALSASDQSGLIGRADTQMLLGDQVEVLALSGAWASVVVPDQATTLDSRGYPGWVPTVQLSAVAPPAAESMATVITPTAWLFRSGVPVTEVSFGTRLPMMGIQGSIALLGLPGSEVLDAPLTAVAITSSTAAAGRPTGAAVIDSLRQFLGIRYLWAGTSGFGFDCSGLVYNVFRVHGVLLPRDAQDQALVGTAVSRQSLQPGDLIFLARGGAVHHVAIYLGSGMLLDSPDLGKGVQQVSIAAQPYSSEFWGARRVLT
jgi:cell wall-associated NlpC family hydrolase